ncbi:hypothetical protein [Micromonospora sp. RP3T]|uniref:hypothetical protein n=1 Tax=Micromonospora sp. RP3T TaxID=2135446 RepID=UPI000D16D4D3|nr:hypothetical protein [Micromonospora sp. RP3T]PTA48242.1 hypothetical protein C8054_01560 [Micromonospora sp. RP3T]
MGSKDKKNKKDKDGQSIKMQRLKYDQRQREVSGGRAPSDPSSSDSETAQIRDTAAQNVDRPQFQAQDDGQSAQWVPNQSGPNTVTYDPTYSYYPQSGTPGYTAQATFDHEMHHEDANNVYQHPVDRDLYGANFHLPGTDADAPELRASYARQADTISANWDEVRSASTRDTGIQNTPGWADYVDRRVEYVQATPHQHNESVAAEMIGTLNSAGLQGPVNNQVRAIYNEASHRRVAGGEVARVPPVESATSTRTSAYTNVEAKGKGKEPARRK